ncbi:cyclin-domain-containing protein [Delitschia confertaspora ATCC 74209]|uniref:Cyclin-domain-containing protein n=1 Tax=Delitschia confertaspora ATCC 74209 TaxID=1513339 RepID=A0A9P4JFE5_9PLEO|nr:cyclin-domain-containing protein [Delitschia confertaspora ATCC 74209]
MDRVSGSSDSGSDCLEPPSPPNPSSDQALIPTLATPNEDAPSPPTGEEWDVHDMKPETAMKILTRAVMALAIATGDVPPTPPISRPTTPRSAEIRRGHHRRTSSRPATPVPVHDIQSPRFKAVDVDTPEASNSEPTAGDIGDNAQPAIVQQASLARKFFSKNIPAVGIEEYIYRLHRYCPMSTAVYLAAATYILRLCVEEKIVPVTPKTVHRLVLGSLRCSMKALEDLAYSSHRLATVGGVTVTQLINLEITVCYLMDFDLQVTSESLVRKVVKLQKAAQAAKLAMKLPSSFELKLRLPSRPRQTLDV